MPELINAGDPIDGNFPSGPAIGEPLPDFTLPDQSGTLIRFSTFRGSDRALVMFHRSASW